MPPIPPIWVPSYPGSGSELFRDLLHSFTGRPASDIYDDMKAVCQGSVMCKTHWPTFKAKSPMEIEANTKKPATFHNTTAWLLMRHPAKALPSFRNFLYEVNNGADHHVQQAPEEAWIEWRDRRFQRDIKRWTRMIRTWHHGAEADTKLPPLRVSLIIPYEDLVHPQHGLTVVEQLHQQLQAAGHTNVDLPQMKCAWKHHVLDRPGKKRSSRGYVPRFTVEQWQNMRMAIRDLQDEFCPNEVVLCHWLTAYQADIATFLKAEE